MAVREGWVGGFPERGETIVATAAGRWAALVLAVAVGAVLSVHLDGPGYFDNEGRYAEVAREMVVRGDYVTPRMDGTLFLNKPPLTFWLAALVFHVLGPSEWARLVSVGAGMIVVLATCRLGAFLYGEALGLLAGLVLATSLGFLLEARTLRPDLLVTASVAVAVLCWRLAVATPARRTRWLCACYAALGLGVLAKGFVPLLIAGIPIGIVTLHEAGWRGVRALRPLLGIAVVVVVALPWHLAVAWLHPGFAWDYVVNQHLLNFFGKKPTIDSIGDPLLPFWGATAFRSIPWVLLVPWTLGEGWRGATRRAAPSERSTFLLWAWAGGVLVFFSLTPERLEHYSIPVLPAVALLAARAWMALRDGQLARSAWPILGVVGAVLVLVGAVGAVAAPVLLAQRYWLQQAPGLSALVPAAALTVATTGAAMALGAWRRQAGVILAALVLGMVPLSAVVLRAQAEVAPLFSWKPAGELLRTRVAPDTEVVFEAPIEYQLVGGLVFYAQRPITLLEPPGFIPPTYLARQGGSIFLARTTFEERWRAGEPLVVVSDPIRRRDTPEGIVPAPYTVLGRFGDRWVLSNVVPPSAR